MQQLIVNYSPTLPDGLRQSSSEFEQVAKMAMTVKLYELKRLFSGMDRMEFLLNLSRYGEAVHHLSAEELQADFE